MRFPSRTSLVLLIAAVAIVPALQSPSASSAAEPLSTVRTAILEETNAHRNAAGLQALLPSGALDAFAQGCSQQQADQRRMFHCPAPGDFGRSWAENVAYGYSPGAVVTAWMNSPGHRANILNPTLTHIGIGYAMGSNGPYYTQNFQLPRADDGTGFYDVSPRAGSLYFSEFSTQIGWAARGGISSGWQEGSVRAYRPWAGIARDAMAAFLYRAAGSPAFAPPATSPFSDVPTHHQFYREITWMAQRGISTGWPASSGRVFRPQESITRDAMAAFLYRYAALRGPLASYPTAPFVDVPADSEFLREIAWLAGERISAGWNSSAGAEYRPFATVSRDAMAAFLYRYETAR